MERVGDDRQSELAVDVVEDAVHQRPIAPPALGFDLVPRDGIAELADAEVLDQGKIFPPAHVVAGHFQGVAVLKGSVGAFDADADGV